MKKVTIVTFFSHSSQLGGGERSMLELIKELKEKNIFSHVVLPNEGPLQAELEKISVPCDIVNLGWWASQKSKSFEDIIQNNTRSLKNLIDYLPKLKLINPDLIYSNTIVSPWGAIAANYLDKPNIWHIREYGEKDHQLDFNAPYSETITFIEKYSNQIIANSSSVSNYISKYLTKIKPLIVYNYVDIEPSLLKDKISTPFINQNSLKILVSGTISKGKNQLEAVKVIKKLIDKKIESELLILGTIADQDYLNEINQFIKENKIEKYIHVLEFVKNPYPYFNISDIVLITSNKEAYGRTAVEGMLLKKVVVASDSGGTKEIIKNRKTGFIYQLGNIKELENILTTLQDKKLRTKIGLNGFNSLKEFNIKEEYGYKIAEIIKKTIKNYKPTNRLTKITLGILNNQVITIHEKEKMQIESTNQINNLTKQLEEINQIISDYQSENQNLTKQIEEVNKVVSNYQSENQNLTKQIEEINKVVSNYQSENQSLTKQIEEVNKNISDLQTNLNTITSSKYYKIWRFYCKIKDTIK